ncbi:MAG TPA: carbohydrate kinase family protein [Candidatus Nanoarchaeia archaeon]|nr:carbohydrate kinase family protein [Candidatus Nanoarchaeia archaeon]
MFDIITLGSATLDVYVKTDEEVRKHGKHNDVCFRLGGKQLIQNVLITTGGGGTNTAVAFSRLGLKTGFAGVVGNDVHGNVILSELRKEQVSFLGRVKNGVSGYSLIFPGHHDRTILTYKGVNDSLQLHDIQSGRFRTKWLYVGSEMGESFHTSLSVMRVARKHGVRIAANLSDYVASLGLKRLKAFVSLCDLLILNREEGEKLTGKKEIKDQLKMIYRAGASVVVITNGARPVWVYDGSVIMSQKVPMIKVVDSTGAGDAFASGFVYGQIKGKSVGMSVSYGLKEARAVLGKIGAKTALVRRL